MDKVITNMEHYAIKGIISRNNEEAFTIPNTPRFSNVEEAVDFYNRNKDCESSYNWLKFRKIGIYKITVSEEICKYL